MFNVLKEEFKANTLKMQQIRAVHERKEKEIRDVYAPGKDVYKRQAIAKL